MSERYRRYPAGRVTVQVHRVPEDDGPTIGFVHGLGAAQTVWHSVLPELPTRYGVATFGLPWDASDGSEWAYQDDPATWLARALGLPDRPPEVLVAHSFGANVALHLLCEHPQWAPAGLVLIAPFYRPAPAAVNWSALSHYVNSFQDLLRDGLLARPGSSPAPDLVDAMAARLRDRISPYGWLRFFTLFAASPMLELDGLTMPCLVIGGAGDTAAYPADCLALAGALPHATAAIVPDGGHFVMVDDPSRTANLLTDFLSGVVE